MPNIKSIVVELEDGRKLLVAKTKNKDWPCDGCALAGEECNRMCDEYGEYGYYTIFKEVKDNG